MLNFLNGHLKAFLLLICFRCVTGEANDNITAHINTPTSLLLATTSGAPKISFYN